MVGCFRWTVLLEETEIEASMPIEEVAGEDVDCARACACINIV